MRLKVDPVASLHQRREQEFRKIFRRFPKHLFKRGLEIGCGDGYQSTLLADYVERLIGTDYSAARLPKRNQKNISYKVCDAERIAEYFPQQSFDLIFSSSVLEHLPRRERFLQGSYRVLKDEGIAIHVIPNRFWKLAHLGLHHFNYVVLLAELLLTPAEKIPRQQDNNLKADKKYSVFRRILWPVPHGAYNNNMEEFFEFGKKRWIKLFRKNGFQVVRVLKGPISSGYSFGCNRLRRFLERQGLGSTYVYITIKKGKESPYITYVK